MSQTTALDEAQDNFRENCDLHPNEEIFSDIMLFLENIDALTDTFQLKKKEYLQVIGCFNTIKDVLVKRKLEERFLCSQIKNILNSVLEGFINSWVKLQVLLLINFLLRCSKSKNLREKFTTEQSFILYKLFDLISSTGMFEMQAVILEVLFRIYGIQLLKRKISEGSLIPESKELSELFLSITTENFDEDIRVSLNVLNNRSDKIFSIISKSTILGDLHLKYSNEMWIDFNLADKRISFYCSQQDFLISCNEKFLLTVNFSDIEQVEIRRVSSSTSLVIFFLTTACITQKIKFIKILESKKTLKFNFEESTKFLRLTCDILPKISGKIDDHTRTSGFKKSVYRPFKNISMNKKKKNLSDASCTESVFGGIHITSDSNSSKKKSTSASEAYLTLSDSDDNCEPAKDDCNVLKNNPQSNLNKQRKVSIYVNRSHSSDTESQSSLKVSKPLTSKNSTLKTNYVQSNQVSKPMYAGKTSSRDDLISISSVDQSYEDIEDIDHKLEKNSAINLITIEPNVTLSNIKNQEEIYVPNKNINSNVEDLNLSHSPEQNLLSEVLRVHSESSITTIDSYKKIPDRKKKPTFKKQLESINNSINTSEYDGKETNTRLENFAFSESFNIDVEIKKSQIITTINDDSQSHSSSIEKNNNLPKSLNTNKDDNNKNQISIGNNEKLNKSANQEELKTSLKSIENKNKSLKSLNSNENNNNNKSQIFTVSNEEVKKYSGFLENKNKSAKSLNTNEENNGNEIIAVNEELNRPLGSSENEMQNYELNSQQSTVNLFSQNKDNIDLLQPYICLSRVDNVINYLQKQESFKTDEVGQKTDVIGDISNTITDLMPISGESKEKNVQCIIKENQRKQLITKTRKLKETKLSMNKTTTEDTGEEHMAKVVEELNDSSDSDVPLVCAKKKIKKLKSTQPSPENTSKKVKVLQNFILQKENIEIEEPLTVKEFGSSVNITTDTVIEEKSQRINVSTNENAHKNQVSCVPSLENINVSVDKISVITNKSRKRKLYDDEMYLSMILENQNNNEENINMKKSKKRKASEKKQKKEKTIKSKALNSAHNVFNNNPNETENIDWETQYNTERRYGNSNKKRTRGERKTRTKKARTNTTNELFFETDSSAKMNYTSLFASFKQRVEQESSKNNKRKKNVRAREESSFDGVLLNDDSDDNSEQPSIKDLSDLEDDLVINTDSSTTHEKMLRANFRFMYLWLKHTKKMGVIKNRRYLHAVQDIYKILRSTLK